MFRLRSLIIFRFLFYSHVILPFAPQFRLLFARGNSIKRNINSEAIKLNQ